MDSLAAQLGTRAISVEINTTSVENASSDGSGDERLLASIRLGDMQALSVLFHRYAGIVRSIGLRILRDPNETEDFVQDLFVYLYQKCNVFDATKGSASSWIVQTVYYQALQRRMKIAEQKSRSSSQIELSRACSLATCSMPKYECSLEGIIGRVRLREALKLLTGDQWDTLRLHFFEGYTLSEIAQKKGQSLGNIRHHFYRGLEKLRISVFRSKLKGRISSGKEMNGLPVKAL